MGTEWENLGWAIEAINQHPLKLNAIAPLNRERKAGVIVVFHRVRHPVA